jgi:hypothetical protein
MAVRVHGKCFSGATFSALRSIGLCNIVVFTGAALFFPVQLCDVAVMHWIG